MSPPFFITHRRNRRLSGRVRHVERDYGLFVRRRAIVLQIEYVSEEARAQAPILHPEAHTWVKVSEWVDAGPLDLSLPVFRWLIDGVTTSKDK